MEHSPAPTADRHAAALAYQPGLGVDFVSDDWGWLYWAAHHAQAVLLFNPSNHIHEVPGLLLMYRLELWLFGFNAGAFHIFDLAGHIASVFALFVLAVQTGVSRRAAAAGALFARRWARRPGGRQALSLPH